MRSLPRYWFPAVGPVPFVAEGGREYPVTVWGSSDVSAEDARAVAEARLATLVADGGPSPEHARDWYYPLRPNPEETVEQIPAPGGAEGDLLAIITRNRYGVDVLNTDAVLITDIDLQMTEPEPVPQSQSQSRTGFWGRLFGPTPDLGRAELREQETEVLGTIDDLAYERPDLGLNIYRTRAGFRVLITGSGALPADPEAKAIMERLQSDELYVCLCHAQNTYRARLTPKPWRLGIHDYPTRAPGTLAADPAWLERYRAASEGHAVCRLIGRTGTRPSADEQQIIDLHDRAVLRPGDGTGLADPQGNEVAELV